jgi:hypothetical protein
MLRRRRGEQRQRQRAAAPSVAATFPGVDTLRLDLTFAGVAPVPASQGVVLHAGAPAFFEFACPCNDCDGSLDLGDAVSSAVRTRLRRASGTVACSGNRVVAGTSVPCTLWASYVVTGTASPPAA